MNKIKQFVGWLFVEFFPRVLMEFVWMLFSALFGVVILAAALRAADLQAMRQYWEAMVMVIFNAAALRVVLYFGLRWLDRYMDALDAARQEQIALVKNGVSFAVNILNKPKQKDKDGE